MVGEPTTSWTDDLTGRERVRAVVETLDSPATVSEIAEQADVSPTTAGDELEQLAADNRVRKTLLEDQRGYRYWINWVEPERSLLVGWHQDETHPEFGDVHLQVNDGDTTVEHRAAEVIDSHPLDVLSQRLSQLPSVVEAVHWEDGRPTGFDF